MTLSKTIVALASAGMFFIAGGPAVAQQTHDSSASSSASRMSSKKSAADVRFAKEAAQGGIMEVKLGQLAVQKTSNDQVKKFGQRMVDDHSKANDELKGLAAKDNFALPDSVNAKDQSTIDRLSKLSGSDFDRAYMRDMVTDHEQDIAAFHREANSGMNSDLKSWAGKTLPTLQDHLRQAKDTENSLGVVSRK